MARVIVFDDLNTPMSLEFHNNYELMVIINTYVRDGLRLGIDWGWMK